MLGCESHTATLEGFMDACVTRRSFLGSAAILSLSGRALATRSEAVSTDGGEGTKAFKARRIARRFTFDVDAPPGVVFPLLCPVRERGWLDGWKADVVYSDSGFAENNGIFTTENQLFGEALYVVSRHEPNAGRVEFVIFFPGKCVQKLDLELKPKTGGGTSLTLSRLYTGLSAEGNALLEQITEAVFQKQAGAIAQCLGRYCKQLQGG
jgi:hypothetical protein